MTRTEYRDQRALFALMLEGYKMEQTPERMWWILSREGDRVWSHHKTPREALHHVRRVQNARS